MTGSPATHQPSIAPVVSLASPAVSSPVRFNPLLALRYHGDQFGIYNPQLGDGCGFLDGQLRDRHGQLKDLGTKGSGITPWSRSGDGRLTLKGGACEVLASEALHRLGVTTSRTLSLIETGEDLWRGDEPSPTRSSVMVRVARTHLRFGTCERLLHRRQPAQLERLLRHVVAVYYPHLALALAHPADGPAGAEPQLLAFYGELVERLARLAADVDGCGLHARRSQHRQHLAGRRKLRLRPLRLPGALGSGIHRLRRPRLGLPALSSGLPGRRPRPRACRR